MTKRPAHRVAAAVTIAAVAAVVAGCEVQSGTSAKRWGGCASYHTQPDAQRAWEAAGRPAGADGDGDRRVCETLAATTRGAPSRGVGGGSDTAKRTHCSRRPALVTFSRRKYPNIVRHIEESWAKGYPRALTIHRVGASDRRDRLLAGIPTRDGYDRDEAPATALRATVKADVRYVPSRENEAAGSSLGGQIAPYCDGARVTYRFTP